MVRHFAPHGQSATQFTRASNASSRAETSNASPTTTSCSPPSSDGALTPDTQDSELVNMADAMSALTHGCLQVITQDQNAYSEVVLQCVQIKPMASQNGAQRYRVVMNDSVHFIQGMMGQREYTRNSTGNLLGS